MNIPNLKERKILIATPAYEGRVGLEYVNSLVQTIAASKAAGAQVAYGIYANSGSVPRVRNQAVAAMLSGDFTDLVFIDADMGWNAGDFLRIVAYDTDIVGAAYPARSEKNPRWIVVWPDDIREHKSGLLTAKRVGTGFLRVRRNVFEKLGELHPELHYDAPGGIPMMEKVKTEKDIPKWRKEFIKALSSKKVSKKAAGAQADGLIQRWRERESEAPHLFAFFDYHLQDHEDGTRSHLSEDYRFCDLVRDAGFTIWVDPKVHMQHIGQKIFQGRFSDQFEVRGVK